jgi:hypothetical protein
MLLATIPGRPPLRSITSHMCLTQHERSKSFSEADKVSSHDHISTLVAPAIHTPESLVLSPDQAWPLPLPTSPPTSYNPPAYNTSFNPTRPLSPILSPAEGTTPVPGSPISPKFETPQAPKVPPKPSGIVLAPPMTPPPRKVCC